MKSEKNIAYPIKTAVFSYSVFCFEELYSNGDSFDLKTGPKFEQHF